MHCTKPSQEQTTREVTFPSKWGWCYCRDVVLRCIQGSAAEKLLHLDSLLGSEKEWIFAKVPWEALSPLCPVTTAGLTQARGSVLPGAASTLTPCRKVVLLATSSVPRCFTFRDSLHLTLQSHHGLHTSASKKQSCITANLIDDTASDLNGHHLFLSFFPDFAGARS